MVSRGHISYLGNILETLSLSWYLDMTRGELIPQCLCQQLAGSRYRADRLLGTGLCPKAKMRKYSLAYGKGEMEEAGGKQDWKNGKGTGRKGEGISLRERGQME